MKDQPPIFFNRYQHPFRHTSGASEIILTDSIYRLVAGGIKNERDEEACIIIPMLFIHKRKKGDYIHKNFHT
jgi:hypothetical protein